MSAVANITVKKNDGTTDIVYSAVDGRSGDNPARWQAPALGATPNTKPEFRINSRRHGRNSNMVRMTASAVYPYHVLNSTTGVTSVISREVMRLEWVGDESIPQATRDEAASQLLNLLASTAIKTAIKELSAPV
jgi:hypothetical protein